MKKRKTPLRLCVGCGAMKPKKELIRVVVTPQGDICLDQTGKAAGRGAYVCSQLECFQKASSSRGLERSLKTAIPQEVYEAFFESLK